MWSVPVSFPGKEQPCFSTFFELGLASVAITLYIERYAFTFSFFSGVKVALIIAVRLCCLLEYGPSGALSVEPREGGSAQHVWAQA